MIEWQKYNLQPFQTFGRCKDSNAYNPESIKYSRHFMILGKIPINGGVGVNPEDGISFLLINSLDCAIPL